MDCVTMQWLQGKAVVNSQMSKKVSYLLKTNKHPTPTHTHKERNKERNKEKKQGSVYKINAKNCDNTEMVYIFTEILVKK